MSGSRNVVEEEADMRLTDSSLRRLDKVTKSSPGEPTIKYLIVDSLHTPLAKVDTGLLKNVEQLQFQGNSESYNILQVISNCSPEFLRKLTLCNVHPQNILYIIGSPKSIKSKQLWSNLVCLEVRCNYSYAFFQNAFAMLRWKRFHSLRELLCLFQIPYTKSLNVYSESYVDLHQFVATNRGSLRKVSLFHDLCLRYESDYDPILYWKIRNAKNYGKYDSDTKYLQQIREQLSKLKLEELNVKFGPFEWPIAAVTPHWDLDTHIFTSVSGLSSAEFDWCNPSLWTPRERDFGSFVNNNGSTLTSLILKNVDIWFGSGVSAGFDCTPLHNCEMLYSLRIEGCALRNIHFLPTTLTNLELRNIATKAAQKTWIAMHLHNLETLTIDVEECQDDPVLCLLRLPKLTELNVISCPEKKLSDLIQFTFTHEGLELRQWKESLKYFDRFNYFKDIVTIHVDSSLYTHKNQYETEETKISSHDD